MSRQKELLAIDESNRSLQERIWQLEDEKTASDKLAQDEKDRIEKEKALDSDALKRAAVLWGIGRMLYTIGAKSLPYDARAKHPMDSNRKYCLVTPTALTNYMNKISTSEGLLYQIYNLNPALHEDDEFMDCLKRMKEYVKL